MRGLLLVLLGTLLTLEVIQMITAQTAADDVANGDCKRMDSCDQCVSLSLNNTGCVWRICDNENNTGCVSDTEDFQGCNRLNETDMCADTKPAPAPEFSQASFDLSSFIGGIILVLVLQAGGFFAMRFLKTKDSTYETIEQPQ
ncbi:CD164 sialomucin-like 2 protein isoform X3 [Alosa alosa]|uniref:CD164 sialomucin-like 2 protein isoform X4 n=1 Tax=Alosa sapidissima TaxID=34773 RepID=UPI001C09D73F|nr:CD164 sialomucin-like 2 protein isoform X4 [Alosa sapidissima]XP_048085988.1 CD164 sialomucin-like 2 protein isoform X3 [Alosa alosa]